MARGILVISQIQIEGDGMNDSGKTVQQATNKSPRRWVGRLCGAWAILIWILGFGLSTYFNLRDDRALFVVSVILSVIFGSLFSLFWFAWFGPASSKVRKLVGRTAVAACVLFLLMARLDEVTGSMLPKFRFAWTAKSDQRLGKLDIAEPGSIDLSAATPNDFPQFLGPSRNGRIDGPQLATDWKAQPPRLIWKQPIGGGWSSFAVVNGYAVTMEQRGEEELVTCYELATGESKWVHALKVRHETVMGGVGPRATPSIDDGRVYAVGATGVMRCLDGKDGSLLWQKDLVTEFGSDHEADGTAIAWGRSGSPLVHQDRVIVPVGSANAGRATLVALDKITGELVWKAGDAGASYSSPVIMTLDGVEQITYVAEDVILSFAIDTGEPLWNWKWPGKSRANANVSQPHVIGDRRVFVSKGYGHGCELLEVSNGDREWKVESLWRKPATLKTKFSNVVLHKGLAFGLDDAIFQCIDLETGQKKWKRGRYGFGQVLGVGDLLLVQAEDGRVLLLDAADKFRELAKFQAVEGKTWNNPAIYGRMLLVRNGQEAACYELPVSE